MNSQDRLDRAEQFLAQAAEQIAANSREIQELRQAIRESHEQNMAQAQGLRDLQEVVRETRSDLAHLAEWAEEVTQALITLTALQQEHERAIQAINQRQIENDRRFNVLLEEARYLIRRLPLPLLLEEGEFFLSKSSPHPLPTPTGGRREPPARESKRQ